MPNRIIKESVSTSTNLNKLSAEAEVMFYRLITQADDYGRFDARPPIIRGRCFPLKDGVTNAQVDGWLAEMMDAGLVSCYEAGDVQYGAFVSWESHQRIRTKRSKFPDPNGSSVTSRGELPQVAATCGLNPIQSNPNPNPIQSNPNPNPIQGVGKPTAPKKSKRADGSFPATDYSAITEAYKKLKGVEPQGNEWLPIQQTIKSMFMDGRTTEQIVGCMTALSESPLEWAQNWTLKTVRMKLPEWIAGKLDLAGRGSSARNGPRSSTLELQKARVDEDDMAEFNRELEEKQAQRRQEMAATKTEGVTLATN